MTEEGLGNRQTTISISFRVDRYLHLLRMPYSGGNKGLGYPYMSSVESLRPSRCSQLMRKKRGAGGKQADDP